MKVKVGDKVRFLNDVGGGVVTKVIDRLSVMVENETGFDVPVAINEIVVVEEAEAYIEPSRFETNTVVNNAKESDVVVDLDHIFYPEVAELEESGDEINISLAFVPQARPGNSDLNVFLINDSNYNVLYSIINLNELGETFSNKVGVLEANTKEQTESIGLQSVNQIPEYIFHFTFYKKDNFKVVEPLVKKVKINPVRFYKEKAYGENDFFNEDSIIIPLVFDEDKVSKLNVSSKEIEDALKQKDQKEKNYKPVARKVKEKEILEVDLHIHELLDDFRGLSNGEILEIQMEHFNARLNEALKKGPKNIVFIHGVGNGTLKLEIRKELDRKKTLLQYHDASFQEYGYGATMVKLK